MPPASWLGGFVNPALAIGAALCAVPLLIHLLNRQRHRPMPWAAMRFVLAAYRRTRRRARMENLLLLLLRMGAIVLLAFALARPFTGERSPLAGLTESRRDLVLVLDGSASTGYRRDVGSVFEGIVRRARETVLDLQASRGDRVRLVLAGSWPRLLSWRSPEEALSLLATLDSPTDEPLDLAAALGEVAGYAEEDAGAASSLEVRLLSDLQRSSFTSAAGPAAGGSDRERPRLAEQLDRLARLGVSVEVADLGPAEATPPNLAVVAIEAQGEALGAFAPADYAVVVRNWGPSVVAGVRVWLEVDGQRGPSQTLEVPARGEARASFSVVFRSSGAHALVAGIQADRLAVDDARAQVVSVPPPLRVLLVNGEPALEVDEDEVGLLAAVLAPPLGDVLPGSAPAPFEPRTVEPPALRDPELDLAGFDVIWLANVESLAERSVERLEERLAAGGALIVSVGDRLDRAAWNARAFRADGSGLLPAELAERVSIPRRQGYWRVREFDARHPVLAFFADETWKPLLTEVPIYDFLASRPLEGARVLARMDDEARNPLLIERAYDRGKVLLWLTSIDPEWARVAESPRTLVPLVHELVRYAGTPAEPPRNLSVHGELSAEVASFPRNLTLVRPDGSRRPVSGEPEPLGQRFRLPPVADTGRAGLYRLEMDGAESVPFAVQLAAAESDLERIPPAELARLHPALRLAAAGGADRGGEDDQRSRKGELWRPIAIACFVFLVLESLWAAWIGLRRRRR